RIADPLFEGRHVVDRSKRLEFLDLETYRSRDRHGFGLRADQKHAERLSGVAAKINRRSGIAIDAAFASIRDYSADASRRHVRRRAANSKMTAAAGRSA